MGGAFVFRGEASVFARGVEGVVGRDLKEEKLEASRLIGAFFAGELREGE